MQNIFFCCIFIVCFHADALVFAVLEADICVINLKTKEDMMLHVKGKPWIDQLALDPENELIYWTDARAHSIVSAHWDGTDQKTIFNISTSECTFHFDCFPSALLMELF